MNRNFVHGLFAGLAGFAVLGALLGTAGSAGARGQAPSPMLAAPDRPAGVQAFSAAAPLTTTFTYQGQLKQNGAPVTNPACQIAFRLYDDPAAGSLIGSPLTPTVPVNNGLFTVGLNFGNNVFDGTARWLDMQVNCGSGFALLTPRQPLTAAPYAFALPGLYTQPNATSPNVIGGYSGNVISPTVVGGVIGGGGQYGYENRVQADYATVSGGARNAASGNQATVGGGVVNTARGIASTVDGGEGNSAVGNYAAVGGGLSNSATGDKAAIGGGTNNIASYLAATIGGGQSNLASNFNTTIGGGMVNSAGGIEAVVGGGFSNDASAQDATVSGGYNNTASGIGAAVGGGSGNTASGSYTTVSGGSGNSASGVYATVSGGGLNTALGDYSFAAGYRAKANHNGAFVWGDTTEADIASSAPYQFIVRASGGARFYGANNWNLAGGEGDWRVGDDTYRFKIGVATGGGGAGDVYMRAQGGTSRILLTTPGGMYIYSNEAQTAGVVLAPGGGSWGVVSDRAVKANVTAVDGRDVLARLATIPVQTWNYTTQDASVRHIGPMAQDFYAAFNVGEDDKHITTIDADGVALAAIQELAHENQDLKAQNASLEARLTKLEQNAQPAAFNAFNLFGVLACGGFVLTWIQQRRAKHGQP
jgi:hypothetical protein